MYTPIMDKPTISLEQSDLESLRQICATTSADDEIVTNLLRAAVLRKGGYNGGLNRNFIQRVITQYYVDKSPRLYLWANRLIDHGGYPNVSIWLNDDWTTVDRMNYSFTLDRSIDPQGFIYITLNTNQTYYDSLSLNPDGFSRRVRVQYITNTNSFSDLTDDEKMYFMLKARFDFDRRGASERNDQIDRRAVSFMETRLRRRLRDWYIS